MLSVTLLTSQDRVDQDEEVSIGNCHMMSPHSRGCKDFHLHSKGLFKAASKGTERVEMAETNPLRVV